MAVRPRSGWLFPPHSVASFVLPTTVSNRPSKSQSPIPSFQKVQSRSFAQRTRCIHECSQDRGLRMRRTIPRDQRRYAHDTSPQIPNILVNDMGNQEVLVDFHDGHAARYPSFWLRDHCPCSECTHPQTKQRQVNTFNLDPSIKATSADATLPGLEVTWSESSHKSLFPWSWLRTHSPFPNPKAPTKRKWIQVVPCSDSSTYPTVSFDGVMSTTTGLHTFLSQICHSGLAFIDSVPPTPTATQSLLERIAFIRHTHYGGFWDFTSEAKPIDTAYTNLALPAHTDNTYFTDPCGLQLFHCLGHTSSTSDALPGSGGESTFVDGFAAATHLYSLSREYYNTLSTIRVVSHASGLESIGSITNQSLHPGFPVITHALATSAPHPSNITQIRWNNDDRSPLTTFPSHQSMKLWYAAARTWTEILRKPEFEIKLKLKPGTPVIFNNWRILHGREAFEGKRRICGGYIGMDDFLGRCRSVGVEL